MNMSVDSHYFEVKKTARYYSLGDFNESTRLIFVLHGYGQLPVFF